MTLWTEMHIFAVIKYSLISVAPGFFLKGSQFTNFLFPWVFKLLPILTYNLKTTFHPSQLKAGSSAACDISLLSGGGGRGHRPPNGTLCSPTGTSGVNQRPTAGTTVQVSAALLAFWDDSLFTSPTDVLCCQQSTESSLRVFYQSLHWNFYYNKPLRKKKKSYMKAAQAILLPFLHLINRVKIREKRITASALNFVS